MIQKILCKFHKKPPKKHNFAFLKKYFTIQHQNTRASRGLKIQVSLHFHLKCCCYIQKRLFLSKKISSQCIARQLMRVMKIGRFQEETKSVFNCALKASLQWPFKTASNRTYKKQLGLGVRTHQHGNMGTFLMSQCVAINSNGLGTRNMGFKAS